jgi:hypothetical protein
VINVEGLLELKESFSFGLKIGIPTIALKANEFDFNIIDLSIFYISSSSQIVFINVKFAKFKLLALFV